MAQKMLKEWYHEKSKKFLENSWIALINCEINLDLNWSKQWAIVATTETNKDAIFSITDAKFYVPVITLATQVIQNCLSN